MPDIHLMRGPNATLIPADPQSAEYIHSVRVGSVLKSKMSQPRNARFHRKFFSLLNLGFEHWEPPEQEWRGIKAVKNFEVYREQVTILAGYRDVTYNLDGSVKVKSQSISFANMDDMEFGQLYKAVFKVIWQQIIRHCDGWTEDEMQRVLDCMEGYA